MKSEEGEREREEERGEKGKKRKGKEKKKIKKKKRQKKKRTPPRVSTLGVTVSNLLTLYLMEVLQYMSFGVFIVLIL